MKSNKSIYIGIFACLCLLFHSCTKDEPLSKELFAYIKSDGINVHSTEINFIRTPSSVTGQTTAKFTAYLTRETSKDVSVSVQADPALIDEYNNANNTSYLPLPSNNYTLEGQAELRIKSGDTFLKDSVAIVLTRQKELSDQRGYILPVSIRSISSDDKGIQRSSTHKTVFIIVTSSLTNVNSTITTIPSGQIVDRKDWSILSASPSYGGNKGENAFDGDNTTAWFANYGTGNQISIDLKNEQTIMGFVLTPCYLFGPTYNASEMTIITSTDNINWTEQGTFKTAKVSLTSSAQTPDNRNVNFYDRVRCRYVKFILDRGLPANYNGFAEINAYK